MKKLKFTSSRPLVFISTETTGVDVRTARIVRLTTQKMDADRALISEVKSRLINPLRRIPPGATNLHGISNEDVEDAPPFSAYAKDLATLLVGADIAGYSVKRFHIPVLTREFKRSGVEFPYEERSILDAQEIFYRLFPRDLRAAYRIFVKGELPPRSQPDKRLTAIAEILANQISEHFQDSPGISDIAAWAKGTDETWLDPDGRFVKGADDSPMFTFGQYSGERLPTIAKKDPEYLIWILHETSANAKVKALIQDAIENAGWSESKNTDSD